LESFINNGSISITSVNTDMYDIITPEFMKYLSLEATEIPAPNTESEE
jgi:hypothetical protein